MQKNLLSSKDKDIDINTLNTRNITQAATHALHKYIHTYTYILTTYLHTYYTHKHIHTHTQTLWCIVVPRHTCLRHRPSTQTSTTTGTHTYIHKTHKHTTHMVYIHTYIPYTHRQTQHAHPQYTPRCPHTHAFYVPFVGAGVPWGRCTPPPPNTHTLRSLGHACARITAICAHTNNYTCIHTYIRTYTYTHTYTYKHTYISDRDTEITVHAKVDSVHTVHAQWHGRVKYNVFPNVGDSNIEARRHRPERDKQSS